MIERSLIYTVVVVGIAFAGSDIFKAEILTGYEISPRLAHPDQQNLVSVKNTGPVQANTVVFQISANATIVKFSDVCAEGHMTRLNATTLVAEFPIMTPYVQCRFGLVVYEPTSLNYTITSDGRLGSWSGGPSTLLLYAIAAMPVAIVLLELAFFYYSIRDILVSGLYRVTMKIIRSNFTPSENSNKTIEFVKCTYGIKIDKVDATILERIYCRKKTTPSLMKNTTLSRLHIKYRINKMCRCELLTKDRKEVEEELDKHFKGTTKCTSSSATV